MIVSQFRCPCCGWEVNLDFKISDEQKQEILRYLQIHLSRVDEIKKVGFHAIGDWFCIYIDADDYGSMVSEKVFSMRNFFCEKFISISFEIEYCPDRLEKIIEQAKHGEAGVIFIRSGKEKTILISPDDAEDIEWHEIHDEINEARRIGEIE